MHPHSIDTWKHAHEYVTSAELSAERRTRWVVYLTLGTMVVELVAGWLTGSMALLADGWHMGSHAAALGISVFAYRFSRLRAGDARFTFGTGKVPTLAGYTSALLLGLGALWLLWVSLGRLFQPIQIHYGEAIGVATLGLTVNVASAWILGAGAGHHHHGHDHRHHDHDHHDHAHATHGEHRDHNLRAAYLHVIADALTSLLAIAALSAGMLLGWAFLDPMMGIVGALLIGRWAYGLAVDSARTLLDAEDHGETAERVRAAVEALDDVQVADLHLWRVGAASRACIVSLVTHEPRPVEAYRSVIQGIPGIDHLTIEVNRCRDARCRDARPSQRGAEGPPRG
jgi:cation diffusion facilitator family transporter